MSEIRKNYQIKTYGFDGTYKKTINPSLIMEDLTFTMNINGGYGQMSVTLNLPVSNDYFDKSDIVEVTCFDPDNMSGRLVYRGIITRTQRHLSNKGEFIVLTCVGMQAFMNRLLFNYSSSYVFTRNQSPDLTIKNIIDYFNTIYTAGRVSYSGGLIQSYGSSVSIDFDYTKCGDGIGKVQKSTSSRFYFIDCNGQFTYKAKTAPTTNHRLKITQEIDDFVSDEEVETTSNSVFVKWKTTTNGPYSDAPSQAQYGRIDTSQNATYVENNASAIIFGNDYLAANKTEKKQIKMTVNSNYDIESIKPGHTITILNTDYETVAMQVQKVSYRYDKLVVELDKYVTFPQTILENN